MNRQTFESLLGNLQLSLILDTNTVFFFTLENCQVSVSEVDTNERASNDSFPQNLRQLGIFTSVFHLSIMLSPSPHYLHAKHCRCHRKPTLNQIFQASECEDTKIVVVHLFQIIIDSLLLQASKQCKMRWKEEWPERRDKNMKSCRVLVLCC